MKEYESLSRFWIFNVKDSPLKIEHLHPKVHMFQLVGVGLGDAKDVTVRGLEAIQAADIVYLEAYTSFLINSSHEELAKFYGRPVLIADRSMVESGEVLAEAQHKAVVLLVVGDVFGATTHSDLVVRCTEQGIPLKVIHNASIINAVGCCGLQLYRFGQVLSLCFWTDSWRPDSWYERLQQNRSMGLHTLLLLDIKVKEVSDENLARGRVVYEPPRYMKVSEAINQVLEVEAHRKSGAVAEDGSTMAIGVARVGSQTQQIVYGSMLRLMDVDFGLPLHSLIIPGEIHECERDHVSLYKLNGDM